MSAFWFFSAIGAAVLVYGLWRWRAVSRISTWPTTNGRVLIAEQTPHETATPAYVSGRRYTTTLEFEYEVGGHVYHGTRFSLHNFTTGMGDDLPYRKDESVVIRYNPRQPSDAILWTPSYSGVIAAVFAGCFVLLLSALLQLAA